MNRNIKAQERALEQFRHDIEGKGSNFAQRVVGYVCDSLGIERVRERSKTGHRGIVNARALGLSKHKPGKRKKKAKKAVRPWLVKRAAERREVADCIVEYGRSLGPDFRGFSRADVKRLTEKAMRASARALAADRLEASEAQP